MYTFVRSLYVIRFNFEAKIPQAIFQSNSIIYWQTLRNYPFSSQGKTIHRKQFENNFVEWYRHETYWHQVNTNMQYAHVICELQNIIRTYCPISGHNFNICVWDFGIQSDIPVFRKFYSVATVPSKVYLSIWSKPISAKHTVSYAHRHWGYAPPTR